MLSSYDREDLRIVSELTEGWPEAEEAPGLLAEDEPAFEINPKGVFETVAPRNLKIIELLSLGWKGREIADEVFHLAPNTYYNNQAVLLRHLAVSNVPQLINVACENGLFLENPALNRDSPLLSEGMRRQLHLLAQGLTTKEYAPILGVSEHYLRNRIPTLRARLGARTIAHAIRIAWQHKILPLNLESSHDT